MKLGLIKVHTDIALGYFSSLELVTNLELSLSFARDMCHFARLAVDSNNKALEKDNVGQSHSHVIAAQPLLEMSTDNFPNEPPGFGFDVSVLLSSIRLPVSPCHLVHFRYCGAVDSFGQVTLSYRISRRMTSSAPCRMRPSKCGALYSHLRLQMTSIFPHDESLPV